MLPPLSPLPTAPPVQESADALRRQLRLRPEAPRPGVRPLQRDARWIADLVLEKLTPLPGDQREHSAIEALHRKLCNSEPRLEVSAEELADFYAFFKKAEHLLKRHRSRQRPDVEADYTLCRALKWQFRAAVSEGKHLHLTQKLLPSLAYIRGGGERINHRHLGYNFALEPTRQLSAGPYLAADSLLEITPAQRVKSTRVIAVQGTLKSTLSELGEAQSQNQLGLGYVTSREYASLEDYADARSHSVRTALSESIGRTARNLPGLLSDSYNLHRHRAYSALSQPYVSDTLASAGLVDVELPGHPSPVGPVITERGIALNARSKVAVDFFSFLNLNTTMALTLQRTQPQKSLDILSLHDTAPTLARQQLGTSQPHEDDPVTLLDDMRHHVSSSSRQFTQQVSTPVLASQLNSSLRANHRQARSLLERYVRLTTQARIDPDLDRELRGLIHQHGALLRPEALKVYRLTTQIQTLSGLVAATASSQSEAGRGVTIDVSHRKQDDPHLSGDYLAIDIAPIKSLEIVKKTLRHVLSGIGDQTFDWEALIHSISASLLDPAKKASTHVLVKIKYGQPVVLFTRHTLSKDRDLLLPEPVKQYSGVDAQSLRTRQTLHKAQLGHDSLDYLLPIARRYLPSPQERPGWERYLHQHADALNALLDSLARPVLGTVLSAELDALRSINPTLRQAVETLTEHAHAALEAPSPENRTRAWEAFNQLLLEYLPHYEAKVSEAWTLS